MAPDKSGSAIDIFGQFFVFDNDELEYNVGGKNEQNLGKLEWLKTKDSHQSPALPLMRTI